MSPLRKGIFRNKFRCIQKRRETEDGEEQRKRREVERSEDINTFFLLSLSWFPSPPLYLPAISHPQM